MAFVGVHALAAWSHLLFIPAGYYLLLAFGLALYLANICIAFWTAWRQQLAPLRRSQRWDVYLCFFALASIGGALLIGSRGALLGFDVFRVPSVSMDGTLLRGDHFIANTWKFRSTAPARGEVVVFRPPQDPSTRFVMRVVGLPGDTVDIRPGQVRLNGVPLDEPYVSAGNNRGLPIGNGIVVVPANSYFILGDNRDNSLDSRLFGPVPAANLYASVEFISLSYDPKDGLRTARMGMRVR